MTLTLYIAQEGVIIISEAHLKNVEAVEGTTEIEWGYIEAYIVTSDNIRADCI